MARPYPRMQREPPNEDSRREVIDRLSALGCPMPLARVTLQRWTADRLSTGMLERTAVSTGIAGGRTVTDVANDCGISPWRALHHLSREPSMGTSEANQWRLATEDDELD